MGTKSKTAHRQKRSKSYGYETEVAALKALRKLFPRLRRTGSVAYKKSAADLVQNGMLENTVRLVVTRDKSQPLLVTLTANDFLSLVQPGREVGVLVQVKGRKKTWIGGLMRELRKLK